MTSRLLDCGCWLLRPSNVDNVGDKSRQGRPLTLHLPAPLPAPGEQLRRAHAMPPCERIDRLLPGEAIRHDRCLDLRQPIPPPPRPGEHLEARYPASAIINTWNRHTTSPLHKIRAQKLGGMLQARKVGPGQRLPFYLQNLLGDPCDTV